MSKTSVFYAMTALLLAFSLFVAGCSDDDDGDGGSTTDPAQLIVGTWISAGDDVAPLLNTLFAAVGGVDSIYAYFNEDGTYSVRQVNGDGTESALYGTYVTTESSVEGIRNIAIVQSAPYSADVSGIYEINTNVNPHRMTYEVVQTSGTNNTAPTAEAGFGSTNGGALGTTNVQHYVRADD
ncbi:MAG: hypothetical protein D6675_13325 [Gemmatimonadetes bacterium]|nr:MAG: hypothetical protein D6675_13325 [Gemmatimonadota bacterium]